MSLGLYLHIPFCQAICSYCNFNRGLLDEGLKKRYVQALEREIRSGPGPQAQGPRPESAEMSELGPRALGLGPDADTIFFGGGTPSLLEPCEVAQLIRACGETFDLAPGSEITLETNPETATRQRLDLFREAGVNRLSFGVQSFSDRELARLGRLHSADRAKQAVRDARAAGFTNISIDLMFWLPGQTLASWLQTVDEAIELNLDHLSLYLLELYPNAPLEEALARGRLDAQAADDEAADMYLEALARLDAAGFDHYEISNVARPGRSSRHNLKYWQAGDWRGFGCGAHSTVGGVRWKNVASTDQYVRHLDAGAAVAIERHTLTKQERLEESLFTGLRLSSGVSREMIRDIHGVDPWLAYGPQLEPYRAGGFLWEAQDYFGLTRQGMLVANEILSTFV
jgi:oxygen-independent coproporphyrinogen-3 oxidase